MFNIELIKHKRKLKQDFSDSFDTLKDELGNVPLKMQSDAYLNGAILSICQNYLNAQNIYKNAAKVLIIDAVCEELYRRESVEVQTRIDEWLTSNDHMFMQGYQHIKKLSDHNSSLQLLTKYIQQNYVQATSLMI